ncbi:type II toxin-antitoxin system VapC family toxin [Meiothermus sp. CFH 77666]|uniref:type II toxin-antitoxin system VapC family toxin n=1 Tax=Meiothermus sp. CFH 77666 TaxID=2817942 RepID=UPI001AA0391D|nr:type II toxin-antitoxin system VapC family toxin [Meiothermus sp. CFH 77666]MBO1437384.1 type II toxin-antitoxin system VapC family toxin [Meiothermus sp. CFH 77666]
MILLDTNVLSEFMRPQPSARVVAWLDEQPAAKVYTNAISRAEIELGLALMPESKRQEALRKAARAMFEEDFAGRCLPFDEGAARHYARIVSTRLKVGRPISVEDAQIAAIALKYKMHLATRNTADFEHIPGLEVVNPWTVETY